MSQQLKTDMLTKMVENSRKEEDKMNRQISFDEDFEKSKTDRKFDRSKITPKYKSTHGNKKFKKLNLNIISSKSKKKILFKTKKTSSPIFTMSRSLNRTGVFFDRYDLAMVAKSGK